MDTLHVQLGFIRGLTLLSRHHSPSLSIVDEFNKKYTTRNEKILLDFQRMLNHVANLSVVGFLFIAKIPVTIYDNESSFNNI